MDKEVLLTQKGFDELNERLNYLESQKRREVSERIKEAREYGDISENSEYDAAKNEQSMVEGEIAEIQAKLRVAKIISSEENEDVVGLGKTVCIYHEKIGKDQTFMIVGTTEANAVKGKMSNESPVGKAIMGHKTGDSVIVKAPAGDFTIIIKEVK